MRDSCSFHLMDNCGPLLAKSMKTFNDRVAFGFIRHKHSVVSFWESLFGKSFLSRPFQLALAFTIVLYGEYLLALLNLTLR